MAIANRLALVSLERLSNFDFRSCCCLCSAIAVDNPSVVRLQSCFVAQLIFSLLLFCENVSLHSFSQSEHTKFARKTSVKTKRTCFSVQQYRRDINFNTNCMFQVMFV